MPHRLALEVIQRIFSYAYAEDVLQYRWVCRAWNLAASDRLVFKAILENGNGRRADFSFVWRRVPDYLSLHQHHDYTVWARFAVADSLAAHLAIRQAPLIQSDIDWIMTWLPICALYAHPAITKLNSRAINLVTSLPASSFAGGWLQALILRLSSYSSFDILCAARRLALQRTHAILRANFANEYANLLNCRPQLSLTELTLRTNNLLDRHENSLKSLQNLRYTVTYFNESYHAFYRPACSRDYHTLFFVPPPFTSDAYVKLNSSALQYMKNPATLQHHVWNGIDQIRLFLGPLDISKFAPCAPGMEGTLSTYPPLQFTMSDVWSDERTPLELANYLFFKLELRLTFLDTLTEYGGIDRYKCQGFHVGRNQPFTGEMIVKHSTDDFYLQTILEGRRSYWHGIITIDGWWARRLQWEGNFSDIYAFNFTPIYIVGIISVFWRASAGDPILLNPNF